MRISDANLKGLHGLEDLRIKHLLYNCCEWELQKTCPSFYGSLIFSTRLWKSGRWGHVSFFSIDFFFFFERERDIDLSFYLFIHSLVASFLCLDLGSNPQPWSIEMTLSNWTTQPGQRAMCSCCQRLYSQQSAVSIEHSQSIFPQLNILWLSAFRLLSE